MNLRLKSLQAMLVSLMLAVGLTVAVPAMADDGIVPYDGHNDASFHFNLGIGGAGTTAGTAGEAKYESTPLMICVYSISVDRCRVYGEGAHDRYGAWADGSSLTLGGYGTIYNSDNYNSNGGNRLILRTWINERNYSYARLTAYQSSGAGYLTGVWSPDCFEQSSDIELNAGSH